MTIIDASSGHYTDIQVASAKSAAGDTILLPSGKHNLVETDDNPPTPLLDFKAGVTVRGTRTQRDANGQVISWNTILNMPFELPSRSLFRVNGGYPECPIGDPSAGFRFTDSKMIGWRYYDNLSVTTYAGLEINRILNFRVDHCHLQDLCGSAVWTDGNPEGGTGAYNQNGISGVIDHNRLVNTYGDPGWAVYPGTVGYGIGMRRWPCNQWEPLSNVLGKYTPYSIFIEDNYFSKWRHDTCTNDGLHQVVRRNVFEGSYGIGEVDGHGSYADDVRTKAVGTRCMEIYDNLFINPDKRWHEDPFAWNIRGGSVIATRNKLVNYPHALDFNNDWGNYEPYRPDCKIRSTYIWDNDLGGAVLIHYNADSVENVDYFLRAPNLIQDGFAYTPYTYPHPLTREAPLPTHLLTVRSTPNGIPFTVRKVA